MSCTQLSTAQGAKDFYESIAGEYDEELNEAWYEYLALTFPQPLFEFVKHTYRGGKNAEELTEWCYKFRDHKLNKIADSLTDFTFPDQEDWEEVEYSSALGDCIDEAWRERRDRNFLED